MMYSCDNARRQFVAQHRPTGIDLILRARAMRREWLLATCTRWSEKVAGLVLELVAHARPDRLRQPAAARVRISAVR